MFDFASIKKSLTSVKSQASSLQKSILEKEERLLFLQRAPMNRAALAEILCGYIEGEGGRFPSRLSEKLNPMLRGIVPTPNPNWQAGSVINFFSEHIGNQTPVDQSGLFFLLGDVMKDGIKKAVLAMPVLSTGNDSKTFGWPAEGDCGPSMAARQPEIERLVKEISTHRKELAKLASDAQQAGFSMN